MIVSIILVRCLYFKGLATPQHSPTKKLMFTLISLICVDDTNLNALNLEGKSTLEVIELDQKILDAWKFALSISIGDLKLEKFSLTTQDYYWKEIQCLLNQHSPYELKFTLNFITHPLWFIPPNETRTLVDTAVNPVNESKQIISIFQDKVTAPTSKLNSLHMSPCDIILGYTIHW